MPDILDRIAAGDNPYAAPAAAPPPDILDRIASGENPYPSASPYVSPGGKRLGNPEVASSFRRLVDAAKAEGIEVRLNSGDRSAAEQLRLYANRGSNPNPVARPGTSPHEHGHAADLSFFRNGQRLDPRFVVPLARQHGFEWFGPGDPVHFNYRDAAPKTLAELRQREGSLPPVLPPVGPAPAPAKGPAVLDQIAAGQNPYPTDGGSGKNKPGPHAPAVQQLLNDLTGDQNIAGPNAYDPFSQHEVRPKTVPERIGATILGSVSPGKEEKAGQSIQQYRGLVAQGKLPPPPQLPADPKQRAAAVHSLSWLQQRIAEAMTQPDPSIPATGDGDYPARVAAALTPEKVAKYLASRNLPLTAYQKAHLPSLIAWQQFQAGRLPAEVQQGALDQATNIAAELATGGLAHGAGGVLKRVAPGVVKAAEAAAPLLKGAGRIARGSAHAATFGAIQGPATHAQVHPEATPQDLAGVAGETAKNYALFGAGIGALGEGFAAAVGRMFREAPGPLATAEIAKRTGQEPAAVLKQMAEWEQAGRVQRTTKGWAATGLRLPEQPTPRTAPPRFTPGQKVQLPGLPDSPVLTVTRVGPKQVELVGENGSRVTAVPERLVPAGEAQVSAVSPAPPPELKTAGVQAREPVQQAAPAEPPHHSQLQPRTLEGQFDGPPEPVSETQPASGLTSETQPRATGLANQVSAREVASGDILRDPEKGITFGSEESQRKGHELAQQQADPLAYAEKLAKDIRAKNVPVSGERVGVLVEGKRLFQKAIRGAATDAERSTWLERQQQFLDDVQKGVHTEWHNVGVAMQSGSTLEHGDFSQVLAAARERKGAPLTADEQVRFKQASDRIAALEAQHAEVVKAHEALQAEHAQMVADAVKPGGRLVNAAARRASILKERAAIHAEIDKILSEAAGKVHSLGSAVYDAARFGFAAGRLALSHIKEKGLDLEQAVGTVIDELKAKGLAVGRQDIVSDIWELTAPNPGKPRTPAEKAYASAVAQAVKEAGGRGSASQPAALMNRQLASEARQQGAEPARTFNRRQQARSRAESKARETLVNLDRKLRANDLTPLSRPARMNPTLAKRELRGQIANRKAELEARIEAARPKTRGERARSGLGELFGITRTLQTTADLSAPGRQGLLFSVSHPVESARAYRAQLRSFASPTAHEQLAAQIAGRANAVSGLDRAAKLYLAPMTEGQHLGGGLAAREEGYVNRALQRIPGVGHVIGASERAYVAFLNSQRAQRFDQLVEILNKLGNDPARDIEPYRKAAEYVGAATGRGSLGQFEHAATTLGRWFYSPRFQASLLSRLKLAATAGATLPPGVRAQANLDLVKALGAGMAVLGLAKLAGAQVEVDPRSTDFGKARIGRTRFDFWGGTQPYVRYAAQVITNQVKDVDTGRVKKGDLGRETWGMVRGKFAPNVSLATDIATRKDFIGHPVETPGQIAGAVGSRFVPMSPGDIWEAAQQDHGFWIALLAAPLSLSGFGVQTRQPKKGEGKR